jgi:hypothetical protein
MKKFKRFIFLAVILLIAVSFTGDRLIGWGEYCSSDACDNLVKRECDRACIGGGNECTGMEWWGQCQNGVCVIEVTCFCKDGTERDYIILCVQAPCPK